MLAPVFDPASANFASWIAFEFDSFSAFGCSLIVLISPPLKSDSSPA